MPSSACLKIAILGPSRAGKDVAADWLAANTRLRYTGSCSSVIAPVVAERYGMTVAEAFARRHEDRDLWFRTGNEMRASDPAALARETLRKGDICVGIRSRAEIEAVLSGGLVDLAIWVSRPNLPVDPTLEYGVEMADIVIRNHAGLDEFHGRLHRLAASWGVMCNG